MDDQQERLRLYERALFELIRNVSALRYSVQAIRAYLIANSPEPEQTEQELDVAETILPELDPTKDFLDQVEAHLELLRAGKKPNVRDS